ncbi:hypothetical protein ODJ79_00960 [Actinoplanes sp. KI2]|uniref:hypothetical protein n=1 Tax=Actinoplanes sp. KI2 TaxID=2983315 RepID=UPI0021D5E3F5|nr:hypothetical protein [Actinoplanes sp. KI2]MCU7722277.1 hypothetical protein [Actinoplanes sp. KI2]
MTTAVTLASGSDETGNKQSMKWLAGLIGLLRPTAPDSLADFVGRTCVIRTGRVTRTFGQAEVHADDGSSAIVQVRQAGADDLHAGVVALLYEYDPEGAFFWAIPFDIAMKGN